MNKSLYKAIHVILGLATTIIAAKTMEIYMNVDIQTPTAKMGWMSLFVSFPFIISSFIYKTTKEKSGMESIFLIYTFYIICMQLALSYVGIRMFINQNFSWDIYWMCLVCYLINPFVYYLAYDYKRRISK